MGWTRIVAASSALVFLSLASPANLSADCVTVTPNLPRFFQDADVVFRGTLLSVEGRSFQALTFSVDSVWKGQVTRRFTVYQFPLIESYAFKSGTAYVLFATLLTPEERKLKGIHHDDEPIFEVQTCGGPPWQPNLSELNRLVRPRRP